MPGFDFDGVRRCVFQLVCIQPSASFLISSSPQNEIPYSSHLQQLAALLVERTSPPHDDTERINYEDFKRLREQLPTFRDVLTAQTFLKFRRDSFGRISQNTFFRYVARRVALMSLRVQLSMYDTTGSGFLREQDLENFIYELIPTLPALQALEEGFYPFYVFTAVRKFLFFLNRKRGPGGKIAIMDMITSPIMMELQEL